MSGVMSKNKTLDDDSELEVGLKWVNKHSKVCIKHKKRTELLNNFRLCWKNLYLRIYIKMLRVTTERPENNLGLPHKQGDRGKYLNQADIRKRFFLRSMKSQ